jgi:hypothetical protein
LSFGRLYTVTLAERGEVMLLMAYNLHPDHDEWQLIEVDGSSPADANPAHLLVRPDGTLEPEGDFDLDDSGRFDAFLRQGVTVRDLVPADDRAHEIWTAQVGRPAVCPRCGASAGALHHPLCHTADGVPLFPMEGRDEWLTTCRDECVGWSEVMAVNN